MKQNKFDTPILFIIFNRPDTTKKVFDSIRKIKPKKLYIAADGPRANNSLDKTKCLEARLITEKIDWECDVRRLYRKSNLGCGLAVSGAVNWFFKNVESGIVLEDDCVPIGDFFDFASEKLVKYMDDSNVMHISGDNFLPMIRKNKNSYFMSKYPHVWGWATWRRAWNKYDFDMKNWSKKNIFRKVKSIQGNIWNKLYWTAKFDSVAYKITNTWDYQWVYTLICNSGLSVFPTNNLVKNIGFRDDSTHTRNNEYIKINRSKTTDNDVNLLEEKHVFKVYSWMTLLNFAYFSIFGMLYNRLIILNHEK